MVYFTCNHCGESLKKGSVEKHYFGPCRRPKFLTCVDCMKDFRGEEYDGHTKCITEDEKYSAKGFASRSPSVKGEVKQLSWLELIQHVSKNYMDIPAEQRALLRKLCNHSNVPQKRAKFQNFVKNVSNRSHRAVVDEVWDLLEKEKSARKEKEAKLGDGKSIHENGKENGTAQSIRAAGKNSERDESEEQNDLQKVVSSGKDRNTADDLSSKGNEFDGKKKKKKKRDKANCDMLVNNDESTIKIESQVSSLKLSKSKKKRKIEEEQLASHDDDSVLKKKKLGGENQESVSEDTKTEKFNWSKTIVKVLESADNNELSVKRLRKKVLSEFSSTGADVDVSVHAKFTKKLSKIPVVLLLKDKAKLKLQE